MRILCIGLVISFSLVQQAPAQTRPQPDTVRVITPGNGQWGAPALARELLRLGKDGDAVQFADVTCLTALPGGGVAVLDDRGDGDRRPVLYLISAQGKVRRLGRTGGGPGEYGAVNRYPMGCLVTEPGGVIALYDEANSRISRWREDGTFLSQVRLPFSPLMIPTFLFPGPRHSYYVKVQLASAHLDMIFGIDLAALGYIHIDSTGQVRDTVRAAPSWLKTISKVDFDPASFFFPLADGGSLVSASDRLAFVVHAPGNDARIIYAEHPITRARMFPQEHADWEELLNWTGGKPLPYRRTAATVKAAYGAIQIESDGHIWFWRIVTAEPSPPHPAIPGITKPPLSPIRHYVDPIIYAGFNLDGSYLGEVRFPQEAQLISFQGKAAWGLVTTKDGAQVIVKWQIAAGN